MVPNSRQLASSLMSAKTDANSLLLFEPRLPQNQPSN
jgi:hypothetical protein